MDLNDLNKVWEVKPLRRTRENEARQILERVAKQVQPIMRKRNWKVKVLSEFCPANPSLLGLNIGGGAEVKLRLRRPNNELDFFPYDQILDTMLHELCHNQYGPHNADFYNLLDEIRKECEDLMAKGITGTGQGFDLPGRRLGGFSRQPPLSSLRQSALAAAENRARRAAILPSGPMRLGGDSSIKAALSPIQAAAMAAERRLHDDVWCGSKSAESEGSSESSQSSTVRDNESDLMSNLGNTQSSGTKDLQLSWQCSTCTLINQVSKLGFGCMGLSGILNDPVPEEDGIALLKEAFNKGVTFFDTSDTYGIDNANEYLIGKALKQLPREKIQLATKFGIVDYSHDHVIVKGTPEYARSCCEGSLKRLDVDYIDLYFIHRIDTTVPIEETMGELKKLVEEGKIKYIGLSEASPDTIRRAHAVHPITALQIECSLWTRDIEEEIIPLCRELRIGIVPYSPIGRGFLAGKAVVESLPQSSFLGGLPRFMGENLEKNKKIYFRLQALAQKHKCTPAQLALAWVLHQGDDMVPIPGTTKMKNLHDNIGSVKVKLTKEDLKDIADAVPPSEVAGLSINEAFFHTEWRFSNTPPPKVPTE